MQARGYARVSEAERKNGNSTISNQRAELNRYSSQLAIDFQHIYEDNDTSGKIPMERRPAGARLLADAAAGDFDTLLVWKIDRLGRDTLDSLSVARKLKEMGIRIVSVTEPFDTSGPVGEFMFTLFAAGAQMEHQNILERTTLGRLEAVRRGQYVGGQVPYGYTIHDKRLAPHPEHAPVVRRVFRLYNSGMATQAISALLNAEGVPAATDSPWCYQAINRVLRNRLYTGEASYRKWHTIKQSGEVVGWERHPESSHIHYDVPPIIDSEEFDAAAERRATSAHAGRRAQSFPFLLSGRVRCLACQRTMHGNCARKRLSGGLVVYSYYRCRSCRLVLRADRLDAAVWEDIGAFIANPGPVIEKLRLRAAPVISAEEGEAIDRQIDAKTTEELRVRSAFRKGIYTEDQLAEELAAIRREELLLLAQREEWTSRRLAAENFGRQVSEVEALLAEMQRQKEHAGPELQRLLAQKFVASIEVSPEECAITYRILDSEIRVKPRFSITQLPRAA